MERVTFHSEESGYSVLRLTVRDTPEPVPVASPILILENRSSPSVDNLH
jgi:hypothetical protein